MLKRCLRGGWSKDERELLNIFTIKVLNSISRNRDVASGKGIWLQLITYILLLDFKLKS